MYDTSTQSILKLSVQAQRLYHLNALDRIPQTVSTRSPTQTKDDEHTAPLSSSKRRLTEERSETSSTEGTHLFADSDRGREPPPEPRRSMMDLFRPETLSAYIASAGEARYDGARAVGFSSARSSGRKRRRGRGRNGNRGGDEEVSFGKFPGLA